MILGLVIGLGTTKLVSISFGLTLFYIIFFRRRFKIPVFLWLVTFCIAITAFWSPEPSKPILEVIAILLGFVAYETLPRKKLTLGLYLIVIVQIVLMIWQYYHGVTRPPGFSRNASVIGLAGLYGLPAFPLAAVAGLSLSRTTLGGSILIAALNWKSRRYVAAGVIVTLLSLTVGMIVTPDRYFQPSRISEDSERRIDTILGSSSEHIEIPDPVEVKPVEWRWYGYGFGNFYFQTGQIQPHNIFVRTWYELGLFSIPLFYFLIMLWADWGRDWKFLVLLIAVGMLTDELLGSLEGVYMILGYAIMRERQEVASQNNLGRVQSKR